MSSHPPTLLRLLERTLLEECKLKNTESLLLAVSGGPDSMALLHGIAWLRAKHGWRIAACGVDHGLRPQAQAELELAASLARQLDVPFHRERIRLAPGANLQSRARELRYECLAEVQQRENLALLATAHHADDRAETVLMRLLRGAPPEGLTVLPPRAAGRLRPLIRCRRADVEAHIERHKLDFALDPSNSDDRFLRTRIRAELLPLMKELSPQVVDHLNQLADEVGQPPLPELRDPCGAALKLGKSARRQLRRAMAQRQFRAEILLPGGQLATVDPNTGLPRIVARPRKGGSLTHQQPSKTASGGVKKAKSG